MSDSSETYHEPVEHLRADTMEMHRALASLREELEAVDWYRQRADACSDENLGSVLLHNMREEIEHTCMLLEWLRRNDADFDKNMASYLFSKDTDIVAAEQREAVTTGNPDPGDVPEPDDTPADASSIPLRLGDRSTPRHPAGRTGSRSGLLCQRRHPPQTVRQREPCSGAERARAISPLDEV
jgi:hypothetical protein